MLQKSRFTRIQLYHFDPTNAASEPKDQNYAKTAFCPLDLQFRKHAIVCNPNPDLKMQWVQHVACRNSGSNLTHRVCETLQAVWPLGHPAGSREYATVPRGPVIWGPDQR
jgi:hypothetical protein